MILFVLPLFSGGGAERVSINLLKELSETQIEIAPSPQKGWNLFVKIGKREGIRRQPRIDAKVDDIYTLRRGDV